MEKISLLFAIYKTSLNSILLKPHYSCTTGWYLGVLEYDNVAAQTAKITAHNLLFMFEYLIIEL